MSKRSLIILLSVAIFCCSLLFIYAYEYKEMQENRVIEALLEDKDNEMYRTLIVNTTLIEQRKKEDDELNKKRIKKKKEDEYIINLARYIVSINSNVSVDRAKTYAICFFREGKKYGIDEKILIGLAQKESTFYSDAQSCENFKGLMQTGDEIARNAGYRPEELYNPEVSIRVGARYLNYKIEEFDNIKLALTAYNQGSGSVHSQNYSSDYADTVMEYAMRIAEYTDDK